MYTKQHQTVKVWSFSIRKISFYVIDWQPAAFIMSCELDLR
jgi:hypothetical protein